MRSWILPCNVKKHDIIEHFRTNDIAVWKYHHGIIVDDIAYIYLALPHQEIRFKCRVIDKNADEQLVQQHPYAIRDNITRYIVIKLEKEYPSGLITYKDLKECKLGQVLNICVAGEKVCNYIENAEKYLTQEDEA